MVYHSNLKSIERILNKINMKKDLIKLGEALLGFISLVAISWISTCFIFLLITKCFDITFTWKIATGVWLCLCLLSLTFNKKK